MGKNFVYYCRKFVSLALLCAPQAFASIPSHLPIPTLPTAPKHAITEPKTAAETADPVTCSQAHSVAKWAHSRFGGPRPSSFSSARFATKVADALVEKWDPYHVLHTRNEARALRNQIEKKWTQFATGKSCTALAEIIDAHLAMLNARVDASAARLVVADVLPTAFRTSERFSETEVYRYNFHALDESTLQKRIQDEVKLGLKDLTVRWWEAYGKDGKLLTTSFLKSRFGIDPDKNSTHWLLVGSLAALDPYSTYLTEREFEDLTQDLSGVASGIGVRVRAVPAGLLVRQVLPDSPAGKSGQLEEGDIVLEVDGKNIRHLTDRQKHEVLRGSAGDSVTLKIAKRAGGEKRLRLEREEITLEDAKVSYHFFPLSKGQGDVAILRIPSFYAESGWNFHGENKSCALDVEKALSEIIQSKKKIAAIVLDLRGNPGGFLEEAVSMAGLFLGNQPVVGVAQGENVKILRNYHRKPLYGGPLVVALDPESASASEVLAGALRDNGRAVVVAEGRTYGKGSVQRLFPLRDIPELEFTLPRSQRQGAVKLTTSLFFSPEGVSPEGAGVQAHIRVGKEPQERRVKTKPYRLSHIQDAILASSDDEMDSLKPVLNAALMKSIETKSRARDKRAQESLGKELAKLLETGSDVGVSAGLVEAVAVARDIENPSVAVKN